MNDDDENDDLSQQQRELKKLPSSTTTTMPSVRFWNVVDKKISDTVDNSNNNNNSCSLESNNNEAEVLYERSERAALTIQERFREKLHRIRRQRQARDEKGAIMVDDDWGHNSFSTSGCDVEDQPEGDDDPATEEIEKENGVNKDDNATSGGSSMEEDEDEEEEEPVDRAQLYMAIFVAVFSCTMMMGQKLFNCINKLMGGNEPDVGDVADIANPNPQIVTGGQGGGGTGGSGAAPAPPPPGP